jgi:hypothetical protein
VRRHAAQYSPSRHHRSCAPVTITPRTRIRRWDYSLLPTIPCPQRHNGLPNPPSYRYWSPSFLPPDLSFTELNVHTSPFPPEAATQPSPTQLSRTNTYTQRTLRSVCPSFLVLAPSAPPFSLTRLSGLTFCPYPHPPPRPQPSLNNPPSFPLPRLLLPHSGTRAGGFLEIAQASRRWGTASP